LTDMMTNNATTGTEAGDWLEDAAHENGNYQNICYECGNKFVGHKGRVTCKVCALARRAAPATADKPVQAGEAVDNLTPQSLDLLRKGLRDWETPENRYAAQRVLDAIEARASLAPVSAQQGAAVAWMKPDEITGLLGHAKRSGENRYYGRVYAQQYDPDMVPVFAAKAPAAQAATAGGTRPDFCSPNCFWGDCPPCVEAASPASTPEAAPADSLPVVLEMPDGDPRTARVVWSEVKDGKRHLCIVVSDAAPEQQHAALVEPIGTTVAMPGSGGGFTMCAFNASDVPAGTKLYLAATTAGAAETSEDARDAARFRAIRHLMQTAKGSASIEVNQHLAYYDQCEPGEEVKLQWYPDTPIGFYTIEGHTLDDVADQAVEAMRATQQEGE
jgi:hypothetical protein